MAARRDYRSAEAAAYRKMYGTAEWQKLRRRRLDEEPLCRMCAAKGLVNAASVCDHIKPHRGEPALFFDYSNTQSLCPPCHDGTKKHIEAYGFSNEIGADGFPIDEAHPFNQSR